MPIPRLLTSRNEFLRRAARSILPALAPVALFIVLAAVMTWPQARFLRTHAANHYDVYFNLWRIRWMAHALSSSPANFFGGNVFYPERRALTFSDAMPVEGFVAAPLLWAGVPPVLVHNLLLLGAIVASAVALFVLVRRLTGNAAAGIAAGVIFAFAPYRFDHYMHMELQWTIWLPLAFWSLHRTIESGRWVHGLQTGVFVALQMMSSVYYGIFLATVVTIAGALLLLSVKRASAPRALRALALGGVFAAVACGLYARPYLATKHRVGGRAAGEIVRYSARASDYLNATPDNCLYGQGDRDVGLSERRLFPGALAVLLAIVGLLLRPAPAAAFVYVVALGVAFEMSLGFRGIIYPFLYHHISLFEGLRAPARLGIFVIMFLAVLAGYGYGTLADSVPKVGRRILAILVPCALLLEYRVGPVDLARYDNAVPPVYALLKTEPPGVVAEFPMPPPNELPGWEPFYAYMSTFHWRSLVNGYSGFYPSSYLRRLDDLRKFPDARSIETLRRTGVSSVIVHLSFYKPAEGTALLDAIGREPEFEYRGHLRDGLGIAVLYRLR